MEKVSSKYQINYNTKDNFIRINSMGKVNLIIFKIKLTIKEILS
jgi:hypothetical protein